MSTDFTHDIDVLLELTKKQRLEIDRLRAKIALALHALQDNEETPAPPKPKNISGYSPVERD